MCVFRVEGEQFDPRAWIEHTGMDVVCINAQGERSFDYWAAKGNPRRPGFHANVSRKPWTDWEGQVEDAIDFLRGHMDELKRLCALPEVEGLDIDFPVEAWPDAHVMHRIVKLPVVLLRAAADAGVEVIVTTSVAREEGADGEG